MLRCMAPFCRGVAAAALVVGLPGNCRPAAQVVPGGHPGTDTLRVQTILKAALMRRAPALAGSLAGVDPSELHVRTEPSSLIPGLLYHSTAYAPPQSADLSVEAFAATLPDRAAALESPEDWVSLLRAAQWTASDAVAARVACAELVRTTSPLRSAVWPTTMYTDSSLLHSEGVSGAEILRQRLAPPVVQRADDEEWTVLAWFLEPGQATEFRCRIGPGASASRESLAVIHDAGYPRIGP